MTGFHDIRKKLQGGGDLTEEDIEIWLGGYAFWYESKCRDRLFITDNACALVASGFRADWWEPYQYIL